MLSSKYEVDESYWLIDGNDDLTADQKIKQINELDKKGKQLKIQANVFAFFALATFIAATGLIIMRKRILVGHKGAHKIT